MKSPKKTKGRFGERRGVRSSIAAIQPAAITKQKRRNKGSLFRRSYKHRYRSNIATFSYIADIVSAKMICLLRWDFGAALIHTYCGGLLIGRHKRLYL